MLRRCRYVTRQGGRVVELHVLGKVGDTVADDVVVVSSKLSSRCGIRQS